MIQPQSCVGVCRVDGVGGATEGPRVERQVQRPRARQEGQRTPQAHRSTEPDVVRADRRVEDRPERVARADHVAARRVDDALGRARAPRRVEDEERVLGGHPLDVAVVGRRDDVVPPRLVGGEFGLRVRGVVEAPQDDRAALDRRALVPRLRSEADRRRWRPAGSSRQPRGAWVGVPRERDAKTPRRGSTPRRREPQGASRDARTSKEQKDKKQKKDAAKTQKRARPWRCPTGR